MTADYARERALLDTILERPEFRDIHGPTWFDSLRQRVLDLLMRTLGGILAPTQIATVGDFFVNALAVAAVLVSAYVLYRSLRRRADPAPRPVVPAAIVDVEWNEWLQRAMSAAAAGGWRDAVHFTYWCAVSFLESQGAWKPDRARTPREYLRLLPSSYQAAAPLGNLTRRFEHVWYGAAPADRSAFDASVADLGNLGCPVA
jgi:Domain of unknown function (DUF4129)